MLRNLLFTIGFVLATSLLVFSQTGSGTLKGKIIDKQTKEPISFANVVVEVAFSRKSLSRFPGTQNLRNHLRDRRFSVAASHRNEGQAKLRTPAGSQLAQRQPGVANFQTAQASVSQTLLRDRRNSALRLG